MLALAVLTLEGLDPRLTGIQPFPKLDDWRADGALYAYQSLKARLGDQDGGQPIMDWLDSLDRVLWIEVLLSPEMFAFIGNQPTRWNWAELQSALDRRARWRSDERDEGVAVSLDPGSRFLQILRESGIGSRRQDCSAASFLDPAGAAYAHWSEMTRAANSLIRCVSPGYFADVVGAVDQVALVDEKASFRGSSGVVHRGMIFLSPEDDWGVGVLAEELIHEATHNLLDLVSLRRPLISGDDVYDEKYAAPFRPDKRHLYGNFHAVVVVSRLIHYFLALAESDLTDMGDVAEEHDWLGRARDYGKSSLEPLESVAMHTGLSPLGRHLIDRSVVPTIEYAAGL